MLAKNGCSIKFHERHGFASYGPGLHNVGGPEHRVRRTIGCCCRYNAETENGSHADRERKHAVRFLRSPHRAFSGNHIYGPGLPERYLHEYWFAGDSLIPTSEIGEFAGSGEFSPIVDLSRGVDGGWRGTRNIKLSF